MALERTNIENTLIIYVSQFTQYRIMFTKMSKQNILKTFKGLQYFGHLMRRDDSLEKILMLGKIEGKRRGWQRMRWWDCITYSMDLNLSRLWEVVKDGEAWCAVVHGIAKTAWMWLSNWTMKAHQSTRELISLVR